MTPRGERVVDTSFLLLLNAHDESLEFTLPGPELDAAWDAVIDTAYEEAPPPGPAVLKAGGVVEPLARSVLVLRRRDG